MNEIIDVYWKEYYDLNEKVGIFANQSNFFQTYECPWIPVSLLIRVLFLSLDKSSRLRYMHDQL